MQQNPIYVCEIKTPLGMMTAAATDKGICLLDFADPRKVKSDLTFLKKKLKAEILKSKNIHLKNLEVELKEYFTKKRKKFSVPLITVGTDFQNKSWNQLKKIPYGKTNSYKEQAQAINHAKAFRAVANANGRNKIAIIIPCHRVTGSNGALGGYSSGIDKKKFLLKLEGFEE